MILLYIDTNIFIDLAEQRVNKDGKDISNFASKLFFDTFSCKYHIAISTWTLKQLYQNIEVEKIKMLFEILKKKIVKVSYDEEDIKKAKSKSSDNFEDAMHVVIAEKVNADMIITRNVDHFIKIGTNIPIEKPEWI